MGQELTDAEWLRALATDLPSREARRAIDLAAKIQAYPSLHPVGGRCEADGCEEVATDVAWDAEKGLHVSVCGQHGREIGESGQFTGCCTNCGCWHRND